MASTDYFNTREHDCDRRVLVALRQENDAWSDPLGAIVGRFADAYANAPASVIRAAWGVAPWPR